MKIARYVRQLGVIAVDWRWWPFYLQRRFMSASRRRRVADRIAQWRPDMTADLEATGGMSAAQALRSEGIAPLGQLLTADQTKALRDYFLTKLVVDDYRPGVRPFLPMSDARHPHSHVAFHEPRDVLLAPGLMRLANDPKILAIVESFLGCRPTLSYCAAWWSYSTEIGAQQAENFHRDVDDWSFVKFFVYLTDVGEHSGPHVYVRNSADDHRLGEIRRYQDSEVASVFGDNQIMRMTGDAGTGFLENTFGLHKGQPVAAGNRLLFQAVYSLVPIPYGPARPPMRRADHPDGDILDPWVNRRYLK